MSMSITADSILGLSKGNPQLKGSIDELKQAAHQLLRFLPGYAQGESGPVAGVAMATAIQDFAAGVKTVLNTKVKLSKPLAPTVADDGSIPEVQPKDEESILAILNYGGYHNQEATKFAHIIKSVLAYTTEKSSVADIEKDIESYSADTDSKLAQVLSIFKGPKTLKSFFNALVQIPEVSDIVEKNNPVSQKLVQAYETAIKTFVNNLTQSIAQAGEWNKYAAEEIKPSKAEQKALAEHPEFVNNALRFFTYNTTPLIDPCVENPNDDSEPTLNPGDLTGKDLIGLATYAAGIADARVDEGPGGRDGAIQDAVLRAIAEKDDGKYAGRISAETSKLISDKVADLLGHKSLSKSENQNSRYMNLAEEGQKADPSKEVTDSEVGTYEEPRINEDATIERPVPRTTNKEASMNDKEAAKEKKEEKVEKVEREPSAIEKLVDLGSKLKGKSPAAQSAAVKKEKRSIPVALRNKLASDLDAIANQLQEAGLIHLATDLDIVSNSLSKTEETCELD